MLFFLCLLFFSGLAAEQYKERYPESLNSACSVFQAKCTTCHDAEDSFYSREVLPSYWESTAQRMQAMEGSNISRDEAIIVAEFLIYDSMTRRKKMVEKQLRSVPEDQQMYEKSKLDTIHQKYGD